MTTVADVVVDGLARAGTPRLFTAAGAHLILDAAEHRGLPTVRARTDHAAAVMAAVTGRLVDAPGALLADDPVAAREGLASAFLGRCPVVVVTASAGAPESLGAVSKAELSIGRESAGHWIAHACQLAVKEPRGPVHLRLSDDVARAAALPVATACRPAPPPPPETDALDAAARLIGAATRPLLVVGLQCRSQDDAAWLRAFAEALPAPALVTPNARGALPDPHPLVVGTLGTSERELDLVGQADLIIAVGLDPLEAPHGWPASMPILHLAASVPELPVTVAVVGDIPLILEELAPRLRERRAADWDVARLHALKQAMAAPPHDPQRLATFRVVQAARQLTPAGSIAVFGVATATLADAWAAVGPGECVVPAGPTPRDFALPAAIGAKLARPERRVIGFCALRELGVDDLTTAAGLECPIVLVAFAAAGDPALVTGPPAGWRRILIRESDELAATLGPALDGGGPTLVVVERRGRGS